MTSNSTLNWWEQRTGDDDDKKGICSNGHGSMEAPLSRGEAHIIVHVLVRTRSPIGRSW